MRKPLPMRKKPVAEPKREGALILGQVMVILGQVMVWANGDGTISYTHQHMDIEAVELVGREQSLDVTRRPIDIFDELLARASNFGDRK